MTTSYLQKRKKKTKITGDSDTKNKNIQQRYRNEIWHRKMFHADNEE